MFSLGLVSNERVQPAPSMGAGIWQFQAMPTGSSMTGLRGQEKTGGQAGLTSLGPQESWHPMLHPGCSWVSPWLSYYTQSRPGFLPLGQAPPQSWGPGNGSLEEHKEPGLGSLPRDVGG